MLQVRESLAEQLVRAHLGLSGNGRINVLIPAPPVDRLSRKERDFIDEQRVVRINAGSSSAGSRALLVEHHYQWVSVSIWIEPAELTLHPDRGEATLTRRVRADLAFQETLASHSRRGTFTPERREVTVIEGEATRRGPVEAVTSAPALTSMAALRLGAGVDLALRSSVSMFVDSLGPSLADVERDDFDRRAPFQSTGRTRRVRRRFLRLTPTLTFAATQRPTFDHLRVKTTVVEAFRAGSLAADEPVIALCVNAFAGHVGEVGAVRPFVGDRDFAYVATEAMIWELLSSRWRSLRPEQRTIEGDVPAPFKDRSPDGRARLSVTFKELFHAALKPTVGSPDVLNLAGKYEVKLIALWDPDGNRVPDGDLGALAEAVTTWFAARVDLFSVRTAGQAEGSLALWRVVSAALAPVLLPIAEGYAVKRLVGETSAPLDCASYRGELDIAYVGPLRWRAAGAKALGLRL